MDLLRERKWPSVIITGIIVSGDKIIVSDSRGLHPKQKVTLYAIAQPDLELEVKRVLSPTIIQLGLPDNRIDAIRLINPIYTGGTLQSIEQNRTSISSEAVFPAIYAEEPTVALRTTIVDYWGKNYDPDNRLPVDSGGPAMTLLNNLMAMQVAGIPATNFIVNNDGFFVSDNEGNLVKAG